MIQKGCGNCRGRLRLIGTSSFEGFNYTTSRSGTVDSGACFQCFGCYYGRTAPIGRFGMGALQMLAFVIDDDNLALNEGAHIVVETATRAGTGRQLTFFKGQDGRLYLPHRSRPLKRNKGLLYVSSSRREYPIK